MNEKYEQYDDYTIDILMNEPWEMWATSVMQCRSMLRNMAMVW